MNWPRWRCFFLCADEISRYRTVRQPSTLKLYSGLRDSMRDPKLTPAGAALRSPHAAQLERGFPRLQFEPSLEEEFKSIYRRESLPQIRRNLWLGIVFLLVFAVLTHWVLDPQTNRRLDLIRAATFAPLLLVALGVLHSRWYQRLYPIVSAVGAPLFGIGSVAVAVIAAADGVNLVSAVVLVTIYIYFMLGMTFYPALASAVIVFCAYAVAAQLVELPTAPMVIDLSVLAFTNVIGAMVSYSLERANRTNFLEERLLIETASRDGLTGIHNRRLFDEHIDTLWPQAIRDRSPLVLLLVDIDHFKAYNDYYGHQAGDECLRQVAACLSRSARRPLDVTARYGGEEFAVILYDARRDHAEEAARRIRAGIEALAIEHAGSLGSTKRLTVSIGGACVEPVAGRSYSGFIQLADEALYAAKERGRDRTVIMDKEYAQLSTGSFRKGSGPQRPLGTAPLSRNPG
jgi:diguanylate cyclase (GGDEF)-like protein